MFVPGLENFNLFFSSYNDCDGYDVLRGTSLSYRDYDLMMDVERAQEQSCLNFDLDRQYNQFRMGLTGCEMSMRMATYLQNGGSPDTLAQLHDMSLYPNVSLTPGMEGFADTMRRMWKWIVKQISKFCAWIGNLFKAKENSADEVMKNAEAAEKLAEEHSDADASDLDKNSGKPSGIAKLKDAMTDVGAAIKTGISAGAQFAVDQMHRAVSDEYNATYEARRDAKQAVKEHNKELEADKKLADDINKDDTRIEAFYKAYNTVKSVEVVDVSQLKPILAAYSGIAKAIVDGFDPQYIEDIQKNKDLSVQKNKFNEVYSITANQRKKFMKEILPKMVVPFSSIIGDGSHVGDNCVEYSKNIITFVSEFKKLDETFISKTFEDRSNALQKAAKSIGTNNNTNDFLEIKNGKGDIVGRELKGSGKNTKQANNNLAANNATFNKAVHTITKGGDDTDDFTDTAAAKERLKFCQDALKTLIQSAKYVKEMTKAILTKLNESCVAIKLVIELVDKYLAIKQQNNDDDDAATNE